MTHPCPCLQIPLPILADLAIGACAFDLRLPNPEAAVSSLTSKLRFISSAVTKAVFGKCEEECTAAKHAAAVAEALKTGSELPLTMVRFLCVRRVAIRPFAHMTQGACVCF